MSDEEAKKAWRCFICETEVTDTSWSKHFQRAHTTPPTPGARPISEEDGVQASWYQAAEEMTLAELPNFLRHLFEDYHHDYGTVCHAVAASALAAAWAANRAPGAMGGITGFQAGAVMWEFIRRWNYRDSGPLRLVDYGEMLYPQSDKFQKRMPESTWRWLKQRAAELLAKPEPVHPDVRAHWESIAAGEVPFGYSVDPEVKLEPPR